ncbi:zinc finger B-box domain-containing protein 1 isoform X2 [Pleurodeles waltl]|uniref:zinc finger B-box domain-containing protein 1 isoform X2 n=1 Tax=Pleurodeles waltl TaxID=8319 RepID=UPI0037095C20
MSTSDFIVPAAKSGNSVIAKSKKLQELRLETMHLEMENHEMEQKLNQLRINMDKEKLERQYSSGYRWKSGQAGSLNYAGQGSLQNKENSLKSLQNSSAKMKLKVLKDSTPETVKLAVVPKSSLIASLEKPKPRGKTCGQCENKNAMLTCFECGEDYCVSCFTRIHQKGALKLHRTCPVQGKYMQIGKLDVAQQFKKDIDLSLIKQDTKKDPSSSPLLSKNVSSPGFGQSYSAESVSTLSTNPVHEKLNSGSLLNGTFNEEDSSKSFNEILMEWRNANADHKAKQKLSDVEQESVGESEVQTLMTSVNKPFEIEFTQNSLSYMEKLLLKKHRRTPVDQLPPVHLDFRSSERFLDGSQDALDEGDSSFTEDEMEDHEQYAALFRPQSSDVNPERPESSLKFAEVNELDSNIEESSSFVIHEPDSSDSCTEKSVMLSPPSIGPQKKSSSLTEKQDSVLVPAINKTEKATILSSYLVEKTNLSKPSNSRKGGMSTTEICKSKSVDSISFITPESRRTTLRKRTNSGLREKDDGSPRGAPFIETKSTKLKNQKLASSSILPKTAPCASIVDSSPPLKSLRGNKQMMEPSSFKPSKVLDGATAINSSMAYQRLKEAEGTMLIGGNPISSYRGLEGFFVLGVDTEEIQEKPYTPRKSEDKAAEEGILCAEGRHWRPDSSLSEYADEALVQSVLEENACARPTSSSGLRVQSPRVRAPQSARGYKFQRPLSARTPRDTCSKASRPASAAPRPLSRAASEILEIESVDTTEADDPFLEDDAEQQALTQLEEEFIELKTNFDPQNNLHGLSNDKTSFKRSSKTKIRNVSDSSKMSVSTEDKTVPNAKKIIGSEPWVSSSSNFNEDFVPDEEEEEQYHEDRKNVLLLH